MTWHYNWTNSALPLTDSEKYDNAYECYNRFVNVYGWTPESACAVISNFEHEGILNPAQWQIGSTIGTWNSNSVGLGLGQWTPARKIGDYCGGRDQAHVSNGDKQIDCVVDPINAGQWVQRVNSSGYSSYYEYGGIPYITSIVDFSQSTLDPEDLATCWCACWEGCGKTQFANTYDIRRSDARKWFNYFGGTQSGYPVIISVDGNGTAFANYHLNDYTTQIHRAEDGEDVFIHAIPNSPDTFINWTVDSGGVTIDYEYGENTFFTMHPNAVQITAHFTGQTPEPQPPIPKEGIKRKRMPIWMYPMFRC